MVRLGLVVADFYETIADEMEAAAREAAAERDASVVATVGVNGAYDTPLAADRLARREDVDAVVVLGAIVTGETDHDQTIGDAAAQGLTRVSLDRDTPVGLGITGPGQTAEQARARTERAGEAVESVLRMCEQS